MALEIGRNEGKTGLATRSEAVLRSFTFLMFDVITPSRARSSVAPTRDAHAWKLIAVLLIALAFLLVTAGNALADGVSPIPAASPEQVAGGSAGSGPSALPSPSDAPQTAPVPAAADQAAQSVQGAEESQPAPAETAPSGQQASTGQSANANAGVNQQNPRNVVISIRINSPGNDGPIGQTNIAAGNATGTNTSSTNQGDPATGGGQPGSQQSSTDQTAGAGADVTQDGAGNLVISIRIDSPGDNGAIDQINAAIANALAGNTSTTNQGGGGPPAPATGGADPEGTPSTGSPTQPPPQAPASAPPATASTAPGLKTASQFAGHKRTPASAATASGHHSTSKPAARPHRSTTPPPSAGQSATVEGSAAVPESAESTAPTLVAAKRHPAVAAAVVRRPSSEAAAPPRSDNGVRQTASRLLAPFTKAPALPATKGSNDISNAVLLTLIAVVGAFLVFVASTYMPSVPRLSSLTARWR